MAKFKPDPFQVHFACFDGGHRHMSRNFSMFDIELVRKTVQRIQHDSTFKKVTYSSIGEIVNIYVDVNFKNSKKGFFLTISISAMPLGGAFPYFQL